MKKKIVVVSSFFVFLCAGGIFFLLQTSFSSSQRPEVNIDLDSLDVLSFKQLDTGTFAFKTTDDNVVAIENAQDGPVLIASKWGSEASLKIDFPEFTEGTTLQEDGSIISTVDGTSLRIYPKDVETQEDGFVLNENGGVEFDIILDQKPSSNSVSFSIDTQNLDFFISPLLLMKKLRRGSLDQRM